MRVPQVWFYARSVIYPKLINDYLFDLKTSGALTYGWHIRVAYVDDKLDSGFSIEPDVGNMEKPSLELMQADAHTIAMNLQDQLQRLANRYLQELGQNDV